MTAEELCAASHTTIVRNFQPFFVAGDVCFLSPKHCTSAFWLGTRSNSAPNKPRMCERRSLGLCRQMRRRAALRIARRLREPAMLCAGCGLASVRCAARRARPTRLTSTHKWCVQQRSIARQRVRASHQPLHPILPFSFQTVHNLFFLLRRQRRAMRTRRVRVHQNGAFLVLSWCFLGAFLLW